MDAPWYRDGLNFECTQCGNCCTGAPGFVWVTPEEIERLAGRQGMTVEAFGRRYLRLVGEDVSLIERPNGDCIFWDRGEAARYIPIGPSSAGPGHSGRKTLKARSNGSG